MSKAQKENIPAAKINNIIIVDTHPIVVEGLISLFNRIPSCDIVGVATTGDDLRNLLEKVKADIIFLELKLPATNIYRLVKDILILYPHIKVIAFTNFTMPKLVQDVMEFGVNAFLPKNANLQEILEAIERVDNEERFISPKVYKTTQKSKMGNRDFPEHSDEGFAKLSKLSDREMDVLILQNRGMNTQEMSKSLFLNKQTINALRKNILRKIQIGSEAKLIQFSKVHGMT